MSAQPSQGEGIGFVANTWQLSPGSWLGVFVLFASRIMHTPRQWPVIGLNKWREEGGKQIDLQFCLVILDHINLVYKPKTLFVSLYLFVSAEPMG